MPGEIDPKVDLIVVCTEVAYDQNTRRFTLIGPARTAVRMTHGVEREFVVRQLPVFFQVVGGVGEFDFRVEVLDENENLAGRSRQFKHRFVQHDKIVARQFAFVLTNVEFAEPGAFQIMLLGNGKRLGSKWLRVLPG